MRTLDSILQEADVALYEFYNYTVAVGECQDEDGRGYELTVSKEGLPPHFYMRLESLDEVENELNDTLGYTKGASVWMAREEEGV